MTDKEQIAEWAKISDPRQALEIVMANIDYLSDSYYRELGDAIREMADRALKSRQTAWVA